METGVGRQRSSQVVLYFLLRSDIEIVVISIHVPVCDVCSYLFWDSRKLSIWASSSGLPMVLRTAQERRGGEGGGGERERGEGG